MMFRRRIWPGVPLGFEGRMLRPVRYRGPGLPPTLVLGEPGSGKTTDVTCNYLLDEPGKQSFIVLDSKNTVRAITSDWRVKVCGAANVKGINPENLLGLGSDGFNPIKIDMTRPDYDDQALRRARALVPETSQKHPHFRLRTISFVTAGTIDENRQAVAAKPPREPDFGRVRSMFLADKNTMAATLKRMMESGDPAIKDRVSGLLNETDETDSVKSTLEAVTSWATASMRADMVKANGVDFAECRKRPTTIFASLGTSSLIDKGVYFRALVEAATDVLLATPGIKTTLIIEEGFALGRLEVLERLYAVAREALIEIVVVFQRVSQIKQLYPETWQQFTAGIIVAYRPLEPETADFLSERAGEEWMMAYSAPEPGPADPGVRGTWQMEKRPRILSGEMYRMPVGVAAVWLPGDDAPRMVTMRGYYHKKLRRLGQRAQKNPFYTPPGKGPARRLATAAITYAKARARGLATALIAFAFVAAGIALWPRAAPSVEQPAAGISAHAPKEPGYPHAAPRKARHAARRTATHATGGFHE
jgi:type IV secretory pathway TraG/TraD family ATPase VirD4